MKKKIKTDGVEELFDIVRAIQNGEEPDEAVQRKREERTEAAREAAQQKQEKIRKQEKRQKKETESAPKADSPKSHPEPETNIPVTEKDDGDEFEVNQEDEFERMLADDARKSFDVRPALNGIGSGLKKLSRSFSGIRRKTGRDVDDSSEREKQPPQEQPAEEVAEKQQPQQGAPDEPDREKSEDEKTIDRILDRDDFALPSSSGEDQAPQETDRQEDAGKKEAPKRKRVLGKERKRSISPDGIRDSLLDFKENLSQRGIRQKELGMIGAGFVLAVLCIVLIVNAVQGSFEQKRKMEHVTAEEGLSVTVEDEPDQWCSSYPVKLRVRVKGETVSAVTVGGIQYQPDEQGFVTVETGEYLLELVADTGSSSRKAQIEIPYLDSQPPVVSADQQEDEIALTAADARSQVYKIWYAAVSQDSILQLPYYREYSKPIPYETGTTYYFYAQDTAGNRSVPVSTTMEAVQGIALSDTEISLYPQESGGLKLEVTPEGALLNNLRFESSDETVAAVDQTGTVTGLKEGTAVIKVSANGVEDAACTVTVSSVRSVTISAIGDCTLGTDEAFDASTSLPAFASVNGYDYFFSNVKAILENDDATFANLEGTFTEETSREAKQYAFKGDPSYTEILKSASVDVVTLANNHSSDYGEKSLSDTEKYLDEAGIDYCIGDKIVVKSVNGVQTAFIGIYVLNDGMGREEQVKSTIAEAKESGAELIIVGFHWGNERETQPDETQRSLAHTAVDCGANLVLGHHPHVLQGIEKYNGAYIAYSLGNFCFGGNSAPSDMDTMIFRQTFSVSRDGVIPSDEVEVVPCSISSTAGYNNYQPTPATGTEAERIIGRINEYSAEFGQTFTASTGL